MSEPFFPLNMQQYWDKTFWSMPVMAVISSAASLAVVAVYVMVMYAFDDLHRLVEPCNEYGNNTF